MARNLKWVRRKPFRTEITRLVADDLTNNGQAIREAVDAVIEGWNQALGATLYQIPVRPVTIAATGDVPLFIAPYDGIVTAADYLIGGNITGANTDRRTLLIRKRDAQGFTDDMATLDFVQGVDADAFDIVPFALAASEADRTVEAGQAVILMSAPVGGGLADPGGVIAVTIAPA
jgi:hypothetical protein